MTKTRQHLLAVALGAGLTGPLGGMALAQGAGITLPAGSLSQALAALGAEAGIQVIAATDLVAGRSAPAVTAAPTPAAALDRLLAGSGLLWQQTGPSTYTLLAPIQPGAAPAGTLVLNPVVVGATSLSGPVEGYRAEGAFTGTPLRDIPQQIDVIGREELEDRQVTSLTDAVEGATNVQQNSTAGNRGETFLMRGFTSSAYAVDGTAIGAASGRPEVMQDLAAVERVEVLKGPASVLYGLGDPGGVINVVTRKPEATPGAEVSVRSGSYGFNRVEGTMTGALNESGTLTGRVTTAAQQEGHWTDRPDSDRQYIGGVLEWRPSADTTLGFSIDQTRMKQPFDRGLPVDDVTNEVLEPYDTWLGEDWAMVDAKKTRATFDAEHRFAPNVTLRGRLAYDESTVKDKALDYRDIEDGVMGRRFTDRVERPTNLDARVEALVDVTTGSIGHKFLLGVQFTEARMDFESARSGNGSLDIDILDPDQGAAMPPVTTNLVYESAIRSRSVYVQDQITFSDQWKMLAGLRWDDFDSDADVVIGDSSVPNSQEALTGRLGVVWQPSADLALYAAWAQSFRPQTGLDAAGNTLDAEEGKQYEIGAKWEVIPGRLSATLAAFEITKSNVATEDPDNEDFSILTGEQRVRGIEGELSGLVTDGWKIHAGLGLLDARITEDETYAVGNRLTGVPEFSARLWSTYEIQTGAAAGLTLGGGVTHVGAREGDLDNSYDVDGYTRLDAMASYEFGNGAALSVMIRNLTDEDYIATPVSRTENYAGAPRSLMAKLDWAF